MALEAKEVQAGLVFIQDGKRVKSPKIGNYAVRPVAGGQFVKANGQDVIRELAVMFAGCIFLWLSKPYDSKKEEGAGKTDETGKPDDVPGKKLKE